MNRQRFGVMFVLLMSACSSVPNKSLSPEKLKSSPQVSEALPGSLSMTNTERAENHNAQVCRQTMQHDERNYTAGGLYAPGISDASPQGELDISDLLEPIPRDELKARYGNRSPYTVLGKQYVVLGSAKGYKERGIASWYGTKFHGRATSSTEIYDMCQFSAAHKTLPIPSYARVTRLDTGQSVIVRINDRGPFYSGRIIDLSFAAATKLGINKAGTAKVEVEAVSDVSTASIPVVLLPVPDSKRYLQIASFSREGNAKALLMQLQQANIEGGFIKQHRLDGDSIWRVRIGPLNAEKIPQTQEKLHEIGLFGVRVGAE
jgi:rare lipoprotein A